MNNHQESLSHPYDVLFKKFYSEKEIAVAFLHEQLCPELQKELDFSTWELKSASFVDARFTRQHSDLVYGVKYKGSEEVLFIIVECQSKPDPKMPLRMQVYTTEVIKDNIREGQHKLPVVLRIVIYCGLEGYHVPCIRLEQFERPKIAEKYMWPGEHLVDLRSLCDTQIVRQGVAAMAGLLLKQAPKRAFLEWLEGKDPALIKAFQMCHYQDQVAQYIYLLSDEPPEKLEQALLNLQPNKPEDIMTAANQLIERGRHQGMEQALDAISAVGVETSYITRAREAIQRSGDGRNTFC